MNISRRTLLTALGSGTVIAVAGCAQREEEWDECHGPCDDLIESTDLEYVTRDLSPNTVEVTVEFAERLSGRRVEIGVYRAVLNNTDDDDAPEIDRVREAEELEVYWEEDVTGYAAYFEADLRNRPTHLKIYLEDDDGNMPA